jgi:hypothetical protein
LLLRVFPFLVGHFLEEEDLSHLELTASLTKICAIVFSPEVFQDVGFELHHTITSFLVQFKELFGDKIVDEELDPGSKMIFKGHWLQHYSRNMARKVPPSLYACMRFEGKHYPIKQQIAAKRIVANCSKTTVITTGFKY